MGELEERVGLSGHQSNTWAPYKRRRAVGAVLVLGLLVTGCGSGGGDDAADEGSATTVTSVEVDPDVMAVAGEYLEALTDDSGPDTVAMATASAPGSVAERYATHLGALDAIQVASGEQREQASVTVDGGTATVTLTPAGAEEGVDTTWADFTVDDEGRLDSFTINGVALDDRLIVGGDSDTTDGVEAALVSAFQLASSDRPVVIVEFDNGADGRYRLSEAIYVAPDGTEGSSVPGGRGLLVPAGEENRAALVFEAAPLGGTLTLVGTLGGAPLRQDLALAP